MSCRPWELHSAFCLKSSGIWSMLIPLSATLGYLASTLQGQGGLQCQEGGQEAVLATLEQAQQEEQRWQQCMVLGPGQT